MKNNYMFALVLNTVAESLSAEVFYLNGSVLASNKNQSPINGDAWPTVTYMANVSAMSGAIVQKVVKR